jgi:hypothetical protein
METVMKKYIGETRVGKERPIPVKVTRSVALQVHLGPLVSLRALLYSQEH